MRRFGQRIPPSRLGIAFAMPVGGGSTMGILLFMLFGLVVGFIARAVMPGRQSMGALMTMVLGMVGSLLGGLVGSFISSTEVTRVHAAGLIGSVIGALIVLALVSMGGRRGVRI
jgi:uncharacterized membrane protein YeaQ/YmgE (transglycosylase-associated protein family)